MHSCAILEDFLAELESELVALVAQSFRQLRRSAVEHGHFALLLVLDLFEDLVPVWTAGVSSRLKARDEITFFLLVR